MDATALRDAYKALSICALMQQTIVYPLLELFFGRTFNLFIFNHDSTTNTRNKNYIQIRRPPSDDYKH